MSYSANILSLMTEQVIEQMKKYPAPGTKPWDYAVAAKDLPVQVGSITKLIMQLNNERYDHGLSNDELKNKISDELADLLSLVLFIAHDLDINIQHAWQAMLDSDEKKLKSRTSKN